MDVEKTKGGARRSRGRRCSRRAHPALVPAGQLVAEDAVEHQLALVLALALTLLLSEQRNSETLAREQRHRRKRHALEGRVVLSVGGQEARAHCRGG